MELQAAAAVAGSGTAEESVASEELPSGTAGESVASGGLLSGSFVAVEH